MWTTINLVRGSDSEKQQEIDKHINTYLKGSKKTKETLRRSHSSIYNHIDNVWNIRNRHMVKGLPPNYIFYLKCCYEVGCNHPRCLAGPPTISATWFPGGPTLSHLPLPVSDPKRPWGDSQCKESCAGHYTTLMVDTSKEPEMAKVTMPPSLILKKLYNEQCRHHSYADEFVSNFVTSAAEQSIHDARIWLDHVQKNRKRGAAKAAATRQKKKLWRQVVKMSSLPTKMNQRTIVPPVASSMRKMTQPTSGYIVTDVLGGIVLHAKNLKRNPKPIPTFVTLAQHNPSDSLLTIPSYLVYLN